MALDTLTSAVAKGYGVTAASLPRLRQGYAAASSGEGTNRSFSLWGEFLHPPPRKDQDHEILPYFWGKDFLIPRFLPYYYYTFPHRNCIEGVFQPYALERNDSISSTISIREPGLSRDRDPNLNRNSELPFTRWVQARIMGPSVREGSPMFL